MKALTICQPYAHLIAIGDKVIENRTWPTRYRGWLAIHAGKSKDWLDPDNETNPDLVFGAIVAVARMVDCRRLEQLSPELKSHKHANGPWCWVFDKVLRLPTPVPCKGAQGLWQPDDATMAAMTAQKQQLIVGAATKGQD